MSASVKKRFLIKFLFAGLFAFIVFFASLSPLPAQELEKSPADLLWKQARSALETRQYRDAQSLFNDFIKRYFNDERAVEARVYIGICDYRIGGRTARALDSWNRVVNMELMQKRASPALLLGLEQFSRHYRTERATADWQKTIEHLFENFPEDPVTVREAELFARHCLVNENWTQAVSVYERMEEHLTRQDVKNLMLARAMGEAGTGAGVLVKAANTQLEQDSVSLAARLYEEALKRNPRDIEKHEAMTKLGWCLYLQHKTRESERLWQRVIKEGSRGDEWVGQSRWHMIQLLAGPQSAPQKAIELCDVQIAEFRGSFRGRQAAFVKAWLYWLEKDWEKAYQAFMNLISAYPDTAQHEPIRNYIRDCEEGMKAIR